MPQEPGGVFLPDAPTALTAALELVRSGHPAEAVVIASSVLEVALDDALNGQKQLYFSPTDLRSGDAAEEAGYGLVRNALLATPHSIAY
jgi:hypothetical protein